MKKVTLVVLGSALLMLAGCSEGGMKKSSEVKHDKQEYKEKFIQNAKMKLLSIDASQAGTDDEQKIIEISFNIKNEDSSAYGIGGGDFHLHTEKVDYQVISDANNIGEEVGVGKESKGKLYFAVPEKLTNADLIYGHGDQELGKWTVELPTTK